MPEFYVKVGQQVEFAKTVAECDIYGFAGITGDFHTNHVNEQVMSRSKYKHRIAHGALILSFMATASTRMIEACAEASETHTPVSLGYDRVRFVGPVFIGDTITVQYKIADVDSKRQRSKSEITVRNQNGELVAIGQHILKWVPNVE